ncbi:hypothetical protein C0J52_25032 [Blattella germanica]|nr:hypothetical protein C0J52_25032 [Blattella germanica]
MSDCSSLSFPNIFFFRTGLYAHLIYYKVNKFRNILLANYYYYYYYDTFTIYYIVGTEVGANNQRGN